MPLKKETPLESQPGMFRGRKLGSQRKESDWLNSRIAYSSKGNLAFFAHMASGEIYVGKTWSVFNCYWRFISPPAHNKQSIVTVI